MSTHKFSRRTLGLGAAAVIGALSIGGLAIAGGDRCGGHGKADKMGHGPRVERLAKKLDLDPQQRERVEGILNTHREAMREQLQSRHTALRAQLAEVLDADQLAEFDAISERRRARWGRGAE